MDKGHGNSCIVFAIASETAHWIDLYVTSQTVWCESRVTLPGIQSNLTEQKLFTLAARKQVEGHLPWA